MAVSTLEDGKRTELPLTISLSMRFMEIPRKTQTLRSGYLLAGCLQNTRDKINQNLTGTCCPLARVCLRMSAKLLPIGLFSRDVGATPKDRPVERVEGVTVWTLTFFLLLKLKGRLLSRQRSPVRHKLTHLSAFLSFSLLFFFCKVPFAQVKISAS
jgi:hypothetical protein